MGSKSKAAATQLRRLTDTGAEIAFRSVTKAAATAKWTKGRAEFAEHTHELNSWCDSFRTAVETRCADWVDRLTHMAHSCEQKQCHRSRHKLIAAWKQHFRHDGERLGDGYTPTRRAFQYVRGPMGWTQPPVACTSLEDDVPELELDFHDDSLVRAAELYQARDGTLAHSAPPDGGSSSSSSGSVQHTKDTVLSQQAEVETEANRWAKEWDEAAEYQASFPAITEAPPALVVHAIISAAATFAPLTGLGAVNVAPRAFGRLTTQALEALVHILKACEKGGKWPASIYAVLIVLLPKPDGGRRPIGLFDSKVRIWMRVRSQVARLWEAAHPSPAIFGGKGCGAQRAAWLSSLAAEGAHLAKREYAQTLIDLVKAFERIPHTVLIAFAVQWDYCLTTLRLSLAAYRIRRLICIDGVCSRLLQATRGITAGAGMATSELRLFMLDLIRSSMKLFPKIKHTLYVDDLTLEDEGTTEEAPKQLARASDFAVTYLEKKLVAEVSPTKTVFLSSSKRSRKIFRNTLSTRKIKFAKTSKLLGVQTVAGRTRSTTVLRSRLKAFREKIPRIQKLRSAGVNVKQITAAVGVPAFYYGAHCSGIADTHLEASRRAVAKAAGTATQGKQYDRSLYLHDVAGSRLDPAFDAHALPLQFLALAWWEGWVNPQQLSSLFTQAWYRLAAQSWNWRGVTGPMSAALATAHRIEWRFTSPHTVLTDQDRQLDLLRDSPACIVKQIHASVRRWQFAKVLRQLPGMLPLQPAASYHGATITSRLLPKSVVLDNTALASLLGSKRGVPRELQGLWSRDMRAWLHSTAAGAQWPQARIATVPGWSDDNSCQLCGHAPGNLLHRHVCPANVPHNGWLTPTKDAQAGLDRLSPAQRDMLFSTGMMAISIPVPAPPSSEHIQWLVPPPDHTPMHLLKWYIDGSLIDPQTPFQRVGAGLVGLADDIPVALAAATPPPWIDTIPGAEAWALFVVLNNCMDLPKVTTDCLGNRRTLLGGQEYATASGRPLARIWAAIFACCEDALLSQLDEMLTWGPAHTSWATLGSRLKSDGSPLSAIDWRANGVADAAAKLAANKHRAPVEIRKRFMQLRAAHRYGAAVAGVACREANNHRNLIYNEEGNLRVELKRDSIGKQGAATIHVDTPPACSQGTASKPGCHSYKSCSAVSGELEDSLPRDFVLANESMALNKAAYLCGYEEDNPSGNGSRAQPNRARPAYRSKPCHRPGRSAASKVDTRGLATQAAAFANKISEMAKLPTANSTAPSERSQEITYKATALAATARGSLNDHSSNMANSSAQGHASRSSPQFGPRQNDSGSDHSANNQSRDSFVSTLRTMTHGSVKRGSSTPVAAVGASRYDQSAQATSRPPTQIGVPSIPAYASSLDSMTAALRRLIGR